jgi:DNA-binding transcriptional LysR family regulator
MDVRHLNTFVVLAEELHFGRAAKRLNLTQPPLSFQIKQLEEELGAPLFQRTTRRVRLTGFGRAFIEQARSILAGMSDATDAAQLAAYGQVAQLNIGTVATEGSRSHALLVETLRSFARLHLDVRIVLSSMSPPDIIQSLVDGQLEIGVVDLPVNNELVAAETMSREPLMLALPRRHRLASQQRIPWRALAHEAVIVSSSAATIGRCAVVSGHLRNLGFEMRSAPEADGLYNALALVIAGLGVTFVPGLPESLKKQKIVVREMQAPQIYLEIAVAYRKGTLSDEGRLFLDVLRKTKGRSSARLSKHVSR